MKVLMCNKFYRPVGGPETIMFDTERKLREMGHTPIPFSMEHPDNVESEYSKYFVSNVDYVAGERKGAGRLLKDTMGIIYSMEARDKISRLIADAKPDIAHAHNIYHQLSPSIFAPLRKAGIPTVLTLHDCKLLCANMLLLTHGEVCERCAGRAFHNAVIYKCVKDSRVNSMVCCIEETLHRALRLYERGVDLFITPSNFLKDKLVGYGRLSADKIKVLHNYADTSFITANYEPGQYGLFVGQIGSHKGVLTALEACKEVPDFEIRFAGRGPLMEECQRRAENIPNAKFIGFQSKSDLCRLFAEARFVFIPSECHENCPMVVLEGFAAGKPVIGSRMGGIPELIDEGQDGLLFEPGDAHGLAAAMRTLIDGPTLASEMGRRGRKKVEEQYSIQVHMESLIGIYSQLLGDKKCSRLMESQRL